jgi:hypothetical protein
MFLFLVIISYKYILPQEIKFETNIFFVSVFDTRIKIDRSSKINLKYFFSFHFKSISGINRSNK